MKKIIICFFLLVGMIIPFSVKANSVENGYMGGTLEMKRGQEFGQSFIIHVSDLDSSSSNSLGIIMVAFELIYDDSIIEVTDISSSEWDSDLYQSDGKYYVLGEVNDNKSYNRCMDNITICGDYLVKINFRVKDTDKTDTVIKIGEIEAILSKMILSEETFSEDDLTSVTGYGNGEINVKITNPKTVTTNETINDNTKVIPNIENSNNVNDII